MFKNMQLKLLAIMTSLLCIQGNDLDPHYPETNEHTMVTDAQVFPYMATIMKVSRYICCGALIDSNWVLTSAQSLLVLHDSQRLLRVRLGSINYKKGGELQSIKQMEVHPYYDSNRPSFDLALIMLAVPVRFTPTLQPIRLLFTPEEVTATHFIVTSWPGPLEVREKNISQIQSMEMIKRHRVLTVTHLHPGDPEDCDEELEDAGIENDTVLCLEPTEKDPCLRESGAPVVLNNVLWGVISSWKPFDCDENPGSVFATLVSEGNVSSWIHDIMHGHPWDPNNNLLLTITKTAKKELARLVQSSARDAVNKANQDSFLNKNFAC